MNDRLYCPCRFSPREKYLVTSLAGDCAGPTAGLDASEKKRNLLPLPKIPPPFPINPARGGETIYPCVHMFGFQGMSPFESLSFEDISLLHILSFVIHDL